MAKLKNKQGIETEKLIRERKQAVSSSLYLKSTLIMALFTATIATHVQSLVRGTYSAVVKFTQPVLICQSVPKHLFCELCN